MSRTRAVPLSRRSAVVIAIASVAGLMMLVWPLLVRQPAGETVGPPFVFLLLLPVVIVVVLTEVTEGGVDPRVLAVLGVLSAITAVLRGISPGTAGVELVFFLLILAGRVFGAGFGFVLGCTALFTSALLTGGVGPWLPYQMLCSGWVGMGAGLLPQRVTGRAEIALLAAYGVLAAYAYGLLLNLSSWPFVLGIGVPGHAGLAFVPGDPLADNLHRFLVYTLLTSTGTFDTGRAITNALAIVLLGPAVLASLRRTARRVVVTGAVVAGPGRKGLAAATRRRLASARPTTRRPGSRPGRRLRCPPHPPASGARPVPTPEEPMSALQFFHPASDHEAISLLATSPMPVDSPTQRRIRGADHLAETFRTGRRRPAWVWAVREGDGPPLGVVAAFGSSAPDDQVLVLDHFGLPTDPGVAAALVAHATAEAVAGGAEEVGIFAPTDATFDHPSLASLAGPLQAAGWRLLVERRHYEFEPDPGLGLGRGDGAVPGAARRRRRPAPRRLPPRGHARHPRRP